MRSFLRVRQHGEGLAEGGAAVADTRSERLDGFDIVRIDVETRVCDQFDLP